MERVKLSTYIRHHGDKHPSTWQGKHSAWNKTRLVFSKWDEDLTLSTEDKYMDQTPRFSDPSPFLCTPKNGSCWKRTWHNQRQSTDKTALPALSDGFLTLLSSCPFEILQHVPPLWKCIMFCHCFIHAVTKPNSLYNSKGRLCTHLSSASQLISLLETWLSFFVMFLRLIHSCI